MIQYQSFASSYSYLKLLLLVTILFNPSRCGPSQAFSLLSIILSDLSDRVIKVLKGLWMPYSRGPLEMFLMLATCLAFLVIDNSVCLKVIFL